MMQRQEVLPQGERGGFSPLWPDTGHLDCHTDALLFVAVTRGQWRHHRPQRSWKDGHSTHSSAGLLVP